jgi:hypothetical protein
MFCLRLDISWHDLPEIPGKSGRRIAFELNVDREENVHTDLCVGDVCVCKGLPEKQRNYSQVPSMPSNF